MLAFIIQYSVIQLEVVNVKYYTIHEFSKLVGETPKLQGKRANKARKMIEELTENDKDL